MDSKISVIIPVYNVEPYIRQCLDSVVNQTYRNLEIIIIDDGSPDNCGKICDEYAHKDSRIRVIHKENGGLSAGWNDGIAIASGDWIAFVDSDDWVDKNYFEELLKGTMCKDEVEIVIANRYYEEKGDIAVERRLFSEPFIFRDGEGKEYLQLRLFIAKDGEQKYDRIPVVWSKLYRTSFIKREQLSFDTKIRAGLGNDTLFNFIAYGRARTVCGMDCVGYHYRYLEFSGTRKFDPHRSESVHYFLNCFRQYMSDNKTSSTIKEAFDMYVFGYIISNLLLCYFHPENRDKYHVIAMNIKKMKKMPLYQSVIYSKSNKYLTQKQKVIKKALQLPFIWPLKLLCIAKKRLEQ